MLKREELKFLSDQLNAYRYNYDTNLQANEYLSKVLEGLKEQFAEQGNVLSYHDSRIKTPNSYLNKLLKNYGTDNQVTFDKMHDIVGHRLVCLNLSDIDAFVKLLRECDKINILEERDYIYHPKKSGYRSFHVILEVPFIDKNGVEQKVKTEIQLRTIFQDIFAREEHKLGYKNNGKLSEEDRKTLKELSEELYFYDLSLDKLSRPIINKKADNQDEINYIASEYKKTRNTFDVIFKEIGELIEKSKNDYDKKDDILHIGKRKKAISSIKRKLIKKVLEQKKLEGHVDLRAEDINVFDFTIDDIVYNIKDNVAFKIICTDCDTVKDYINYFKTRIDKVDHIKIRDESNYLDEAKDSGYRGYRIILDYYRFDTDKPIPVEIIIRSMVQDSWAQQQDVRVYNKEDSYSNIKEFVETARGLKGLSPALHRVELLLNGLKEKNSEKKAPARNLVKEVEEYDKIQNDKKIELREINNYFNKIRKFTSDNPKVNYSQYFDFYEKYFEKYNDYNSSWNKNEEFDIDRLKSLSVYVKKLNQIMEKRSKSVKDNKKLLLENKKNEK